MEQGVALFQVRVRSNGGEEKVTEYRFEELVRAFGAPEVAKMWKAFSEMQSR